MPNLSVKTHEARIKMLEEQHKEEVDKLQSKVRKLQKENRELKSLNNSETTRANSLYELNLQLIAERDAPNEAAKQVYEANTRSANDSTEIDTQGESHADFRGAETETVTEEEFTPPQKEN